MILRKSTLSCCLLHCGTIYFVEMKRCSLVRMQLAA
jgi:hypothetical protein